VTVTSKVTVTLLQTDDPDRALARLQQTTYFPQNLV